MHAFAKSGHLALFSVWRALFPQNRKLSLVGAVLVGFRATGLHQPVFHPLFVLPFMWLLIAQRRWRLVSFYAIGYGFICAFWFAWPIWVSSHGVAPIPPHSGEGVNFLERLSNRLVAPDLGSLWLMALNLLR